MYYVAWYKNGVLISADDLAAPSVLTGPPQGISVDSSFTMVMSTLIIESAALDDSGNYTCAVTTGTKGVELDMIAGNLQDTTEVFVYGEWCTYVYLRSIMTHWLVCYRDTSFLRCMCDHAISQNLRCTQWSDSCHQSR